MADSKSTLPNASDERSQRWLTPDLPELSPEMKGVLEKYSKIPPSEINAHITGIREKGWAVHRYPCVGMWRFLDLPVGGHTLYPEILARMRTGEQKYIDLGCAFAQDIRKMVADGVDSSMCYASDLRLDFIELGYELFRDKDTLQTKFIAANIFDPGNPLKDLEGTFDVVGASSFFHLFNWEDQKQVGRRVAGLMNPRKDSLLVGRQVGNVEAGETARSAGGGNRYRHNAESWRKMWNEIGHEIGVQFEVEVRHWKETMEWVEPGTVFMEFSVRRM